MAKKSLQFKNSTVIYTIFILMIAVVGGYIAYRSQGGATPKPYSATMSLSPATGKLSKGKTIKVSIWEDSGTQSVNAVQANLTYDATKLQFVSIDSSGSAFSIEAQAKSSSGNVLIARGQLSPIKGKQFVSAVTFKALGSSGKANISFAPGSVLVRSTDNKNILTTSYGANFNLTR
jgi:hypothetical protein